MQFYKEEKNKKLTCLLCNHYCSLKENQVGICKVNKHTNNKIECLVYGYPNAIHVDPVEKKPLYHFMKGTKTFSIGTVGCNFKCSFCQNWTLSQSENINKQIYYSPEDIVKLTIQNNCKSISYTYNEPTIFFPYIKDIATLAHKNGLKNIMVTNGFESKEISQQMVGLIDAVNVDLKSFNSEYYKKKLGGKLDSILENLKFYLKNNIHIEITTLVVPSQNDTDEELKQIASFIANELRVDIPWHISAFRPEYKELELPNTPIQTLLHTQQIGQSYGLTNVHIGNLKRHITQRKLAVAGQFYPKSKIDIFKTISQYKEIKHDINFTPRAIISPHAGYIYSGYTANQAFSKIPKDIKNIIVIGPSHKFRFNGISISKYDSYPTPLGHLTINQDLSNRLLNKFDFINFTDQVHCEHSTETQMPFIKYHLPNVQIIELIYSAIDYQNISKIIEEVLKDKDNFIVISTDLSHFYSLDEAKKLDDICLDAINSLKLQTFDKGCEACGITGVKALVAYASKTQMRVQQLDYRTSANVTKDDKRVVGYTSFVLGE